MQRVQITEPFTAFPTLSNRLKKPKKHTDNFSLCNRFYGWNKFD
jgi:hypothetical protein